MLRPTRPLALTSLVALLAVGPAFAADPATPAPGTNAPGANPPAKSKHEVEWLEYGTAIDRAKTENKHMIIDFYTNWCGWCKRMDRDTYGDSTVAAYLTKNFVLTKINAESTKPIKLKSGTTTGAQLAAEFEVKGFPNTWFIRPDGTRIDALPGYQQPRQFHTVLQFVHERKYEKPAKSTN